MLDKKPLNKAPVGEFYVLPVKSISEDDFIDKLVILQCVRMMLNGKIEKIPAKSIIRFLSTYVRFGDGKNFKKGKEALTKVYGYDIAKINTINRSLRLLGFLEKGEMKDSENEFCKEFKFLAKYYEFLSKKEGGSKEAMVSFKLKLDNGHS